LVLDTNVLIAAFISRGACAALFERCALEHEIACSEVILGELRQHLTRKFQYSGEEADQVAEIVRSVSRMVDPVTLDSPACRDPDDDLILATAVAARASCLVTGDKDLLVLERYEGIEIIRPNQFADFEAGPH